MDKKDNNENNIHKQHRDRLKSRFLTEGIDGFEKHNALELLLFYAIPRRDVNELAHRLINTFGSLEGVFNAPYRELLNVKGVGEHCATLIKLVPAMTRRYSSEKVAAGEDMSTKEKIGEYFVGKYIGITNETVMLMLLDNKCCFIDCIKVHEGSINSSAMNARKIAEIAFAKRASAVAIAHNHPGGMLIPSTDDIYTTRMLYGAFNILNINIIDHFIINEKGFVTIIENTPII